MPFCPVLDKPEVDNTDESQRETEHENNKLDTTITHLTVDCFYYPETNHLPLVKS